MFPDFKPPRCDEEYNKLRDSLSISRAKAYKNTIDLPGFQLPVLAQCMDPHPPPGQTEVYEVPDIPRRHQPRRRMRNFPELSSPNDMLVCLDHPLQTGRRGWAQVYAGKLTIHRKTCDVVVKLYQECMFQDPDPSNFYAVNGYLSSDWSSATDIAQQEAWAYSMLKDYQGTTIPNSYGFYIFEFQGEPVIGFVMERISGFEVDSFLSQNNHSDGAKTILADALAWAIHQIHCAGIVHSDIRRSNMRVFANSAQDALHIVLFDFSNAAPKYNRDGGLTYARDAGRITDTAMGEREQEVAKAWRLNNRQAKPAWIRMFAVITGYNCL